MNERDWSPGLEVPYVIAIVELEEQRGLRLMTNIVGCQPEEVAIDMPVQVEFREQGEAYVPVFRAAAAWREFRGALHHLRASASPKSDAG